MNKPIFIAEVKMQSPYGYKAENTFYNLLEIAVRNGDWISIHTNPLWGGSYEALEFARRFTNKPILAKGIHSHNDNIKKALDYGADYVLIVDRLPTSDFTKCLIEMTYNDAERLLDSSFGQELKFVTNSRNLKTGELSTYNENLGKYLANDNCKWVCQASGILSPRDVNPNVNAFIVGENLEFFCKVKNCDE